MNESALWSAAVVMLAAFFAWTSSRWWHLRRVKALQRDVQKLENSQQNSARMAAQTRKQIEDLQRTLAEYRRRLSEKDAARRALNGLVPDAPVRQPAAPVKETAEAAAPVRAMAPPGGWADTQPM